MYKINSIDRKVYIEGIYIYAFLSIEYIYHLIPFIKLNENQGEKNRKTGEERRREEERENEGREGGQKKGRTKVPLDSVARNLHSSTQIMTGFVFSIWIQFIQIIAT